MRSNSFELKTNTPAGRSLLLLQADMEKQLNKLNVQRQEALYAEIADYLRKSSNRRLTDQRELNGSEFKPRQVTVTRILYKKGRQIVKTYRHHRRFDYHGKGGGDNAYYAGSGEYVVTGTLGGVPFKEVHQHAWRGRYGRLLPPEMLLGFRDRKYLKTQVSGGLEIATGYSGFAGTLASWHNEGKVGTDGQRRPRRNWFGINVADRIMINQIIQRHLSSR